MMLLPREQQILELVTRGLTDKEISSETGLAEHIVKYVLRRLFLEVGVSKRVALAAWAAQLCQAEPGTRAGP